MLCLHLLPLAFSALLWGSFTWGRLKGWGRGAAERRGAGTAGSQLGLGSAGTPPGNRRVWAE